MPRIRMQESFENSFNNLEKNGQSKTRSSEIKKNHEKFR